MRKVTDVFKENCENFNEKWKDIVHAKLCMSKKLNTYHVSFTFENHIEIRINRLNGRTTHGTEVQVIMNMIYLEYPRLGPDR